MDEREKFGKIVYNEEVQNLPMDTKRLFIEMMGLYTGFLANIPQENYLDRAQRIQDTLEKEHGLTLEHPAVISTLKILNPKSF